MDTPRPDDLGDLSGAEVVDVLLALTGGGIAAGDPTLVGWPYVDLELRCPQCPACGDRGRLVVGATLHPIGLCSDETCDVYTWDPSRSASDNLDNAGRVEVVTQVPRPCGAIGPELHGAPCGRPAGHAGPHAHSDARVTP